MGSGIGPGIGEWPIVPLSNGELTSLTIGFGAVALVALGFCVWVAVRERKLWPVYVYIGGGVASWYETLTDVLGRCAWAPPGNLPSIVDLFNRQMPLFYNFTYLFYFPIAQVALMLALRRGLTYRRWWWIAGPAVAGAFLFELIPVARK